MQYGYVVYFLKYLQALLHHGYLQMSSNVFHGKCTMGLRQTDGAESVRFRINSYHLSWKIILCNIRNLCNCAACRRLQSGCNLQKALLQSEQNSVLIPDKSCGVFS